MAVRFGSETVWASRGRGFSMGCAIENKGHTVFLTGQVAWNQNEEIIGPGDVTEQTRQCFRNIENMLARVGGTLSDLVSLTTYYTSQEQLPEIQAVRLEFLTAETAPVSTSVMVAGLGHPEFLVELTPIAFLPSERFVRPSAET